MLCDPVQPLMRREGKVFSASFRGESNNRACKQRSSHTKWTKICKYQRSVDLSVHGTGEGRKDMDIKSRIYSFRQCVARAFVLVPSLILPPTGAVSFALILKTAWNIHRLRHSAALSLPECWHADQQSYAVRILKKWHCVTFEKGRAPLRRRNSWRCLRTKKTFEKNSIHKKQIKKMHVAILPELVRRTKSHTCYWPFLCYPDIRKSTQWIPCPKLRKGVKSNPIYLGRYPPSHLQDSSKIKRGFICASHISIKGSTRKTNKKILKSYRRRTEK